MAFKSPARWASVLDLPVKFCYDAPLYVIVWSRAVFLIGGSGEPLGSSEVLQRFWKIFETTHYWKIYKFNMYKSASLWANAPSLSLSPRYLCSCKVAPRPPCFITHMSTQSSSTSDFHLKPLSLSLSVSLSPHSKPQSTVQNFLSSSPATQ